jgi:hypothetical protein
MVKNDFKETAGTGVAGCQLTVPERVRLYPGLSCVTYIKSGEYGMRDTNWFDVPKENSTDGYLTGLRIACEVMTSARKSGFDSFYPVIESAVKVIATEQKTPDGTLDGLAAAMSFLAVTGEILLLAAQKLDLRELMEKEFRAHEAEQEDALHELKKENADFLKNMQVSAQQEKMAA